MALHVTIEMERDGRVLKARLFEGGQQLSCREVYARWREDEDFRAFFIETLADAPFEAFRWETPPVTAASLEVGFEFVLVDSPYLAGQASPRAFSEHFASGEAVAVFPNLGGDAMLVVPAPAGDREHYAHLGAFLRGAPESQVHALWAAVGKAMEEQVGGRPVWLNTAGGGVPWLHVRLDSRPKYYVYGGYRNR